MRVLSVELSAKAKAKLLSRNANFFISKSQLFSSCAEKRFSIRSGILCGLAGKLSEFHETIAESAVRGASKQQRNKSAVLWFADETSAKLRNKARAETALASRVLIILSFFPEKRNLRCFERSLIDEKCAQSKRLSPINQCKQQPTTTQSRQQKACIKAQESKSLFQL